MGMAEPSQSLFANGTLIHRKDPEEFTKNLLELVND
jgi:hypothetical protein